MQLKLLTTILQEAATSRRSIPPSDEHELSLLIEALKRSGDRSVAELVRVVDKAWPAPKTPKRKVSPIAPFDPQSWTSRLQHARENASAFESVLVELLKSKQLKTAEVAAIANLFRSTTKTYKSRSAAVEDVRKTWLEGQRDQEKLRKVDSIF